MSSNVVFTICEALAQRSIAALRFNFRGIGGSGGTHGEGIEEQEDIKAALALVSSEVRIERERVGLAGYSFGASVALHVAVLNSDVKVLALVSPAVSDSRWEQIEAYSRPVFVISGEHDFVISPEQLRQHMKDNDELKQCEVIPGADHFWEGYEAEVAEKVAEFFVTGFKNV